MGFARNTVRGLAVLFALAAVERASGEEAESFAVVSFASAVSDRTVEYRFGWDEPGEQFTLAPGNRIYHSRPIDPENRNSLPVGQVEFAPTSEGAKRVYSVRPKPSAQAQNGGSAYVFWTQPDARGGAVVELVEAGAFIRSSDTQISALLAGREYARAIERSDVALGVDPAHAPTWNLRGRAQFLSGNYDRAIEDFTRAIGLDPTQAMYHSNRGYSHIGLRQYEKALADFAVALEFDPALTNANRGKEQAQGRLEAARVEKTAAGTTKGAAANAAREGRSDAEVTSREALPLPKEFEPFISREAFLSLERYRLGSKVDAAENARLQIAYDRAFEEGRYIDAQEANYIRAIEREPVAALWKILTDPAGNNYYLPKFTPVEERLNGFNRPLVGEGSDRMIYVKSDDDLAGLRVAIRRAPRVLGDGGLETAAIIPFRWVKGAGIVPLDPPDNLRVLIQLKKDGEHAMLGMSFSLTNGGDGTWDLRPEIYTSPKFGDDRFRAASSKVVSPRGCMDCHALGFNLKATKFVGRVAGADDEFIAAVREMPGLAGFIADVRKHGATDAEATQAAAKIERPDEFILTQQKLRIAVLKLWNAIYYANQPYLDDADGRLIEYHDRYGSAWLEAGDFDKALAHFNKAVGRGPDVAALYLKRAWIFQKLRRLPEAVKDLDQVIRLDPKSPIAFATRSAIKGAAGQLDLARRDAEDAVRLGPKMPVALLARAEIAARQGEYRQGLADVDATLALVPELAAAHNVRARMLACASDASVRNGAEAVRSATTACELSDWKNRDFLDTLAAAHAEAGNFAEAVKWQEAVLAEPATDEPRLDDAAQKSARERLELYRKKLPAHDEARPSADTKAK
jgi:tetratricopeptide (TPR) repeat protein